MTDQPLASLDIAILELHARVIGPLDIIAALRALLPVPPAWTVERGAEIAEAEGVPVFAVTRSPDETRLEPLPRSAALQILLQQSFSVPKHGAFGIGTLTDLLQDVECYRLTVSDLDEALGLLTELIELVD